MQVLKGDDDIHNHVTPEQVDALIAEVDKDGDGAISFDEFRDMM